MRFGPAAFACAALFCLLPAAAAGGALALPLALCLAGFASLRPRLVAQALENKPLAIVLLLIFTAWAVASTLWSPWPKDDQAFKILALVPLGLMFAASAGSESSHRLTRAAGLAALIVLAALLTIEAVWQMPINRAARPDAELGDLGRNLMRGSVVLLAMVWAVAASQLQEGAGWRGIVAFLIILAGAALMVPFEQAAAALGFALGFAAFALAFVAPRLAILGVTGGLAAWMLAAPFVTPLVIANQDLIDRLPLSWAARAGIWDYVCTRILEQPIIGHGLEASRAVSDRISVRELDMRGVPIHPHSASLQIWFETGAIGAVLAAAVLLVGGFALARGLQHDRATAAATAGTIASLGLVANLSFGIWAEWWIATLFIAAALVAATRRAAA
jgi:O-antigen ligase